MTTIKQYSGKEWSICGSVQGECNQIISKVVWVNNGIIG